MGKEGWQLARDYGKREMALWPIENDVFLGGNEAIYIWPIPPLEFMRVWMIHPPLK
jgi:hypothetical protein